MQHYCGNTKLITRCQLVEQKTSHIKIVNTYYSSRAFDGGSPVIPILWSKLLKCSNINYLIPAVLKYITKLPLKIFLVREQGTEHYNIVIHRSYNLIIKWRPGYFFGECQALVFLVLRLPLLLVHIDFSREESYNFLPSYLEFWEIGRGQKLRVF